MSELKVALIGSAPASVRLAPYHDPTWQIWGCSPGTYGVMPRCDVFFELHLWEPGQPWFSPEYVQWLTDFPKRGTLWVGHEGAVEQVPGAKVLPHEAISAEFDPNRWFCTSSLFWMMATAIRAGATKIGLWGVDMAANEEYEMQRAGIHFLSYIAKARGIEVGAPAESDCSRRASGTASMSGRTRSASCAHGATNSRSGCWRRRLRRRTRRTKCISFKAPWMT
jgi:hypothetical protein